MHAASFDPLQGLRQLDDLVRLTAPPAGQEEICREGLTRTAAALGFTTGLLLVRETPAGTLRPAANLGPAGPPAMAQVAERAASAEEIVEEAGAGGTTWIAVPIPGDGGAAGAVVFDRPAVWDSGAKSFALCAARALSVSLRAAGLIQEIRSQGELLTRRSVELETLWEIAGRLQALDHEEGMLQTALDLVLERLGLTSGWIFWGESSEGRLGLAACRGIADDFVKRARTEGIGTCLCLDVFATGRLQYARNTTECPRLPDLVRGTGPMAHACIPLKFERGVLGVMNIANHPGRVFTPAELHFLETLGHQLCLAVDKARTARAELQRSAEAGAFVSLARAIGGRIEQEQVLGAIGMYARDLLHADRCSIFLGDAAGSLQLAHLSGPSLPGLNAGDACDLESLGARAFAEALRARRTVVVENARDDSRMDGDLARLWSIGSALVVPLVAHERLEGLLVVDRALSSTWSAGEVELADALGAQAMVALENARLYHGVREAYLELQRAQYGMLRAERLAAIGTLGASLAHEVRNPLNSIHLQLVLLGRRVARLEGSARTDIAALVETASKEIKRLDSLVEEFLSHSTIDRLSTAPANPNEVVRDVLALMSTEAAQKAIRVASELDPSMSLLPLDREKLKQALINLVRNAIEAMPGGGVLKVTTLAGPDEARIEVADTGVGIEPGLDVFDFFETTKGGGTGLGLPIARRIVEAHGGSLTYASARGGTTFTIALRPAAGAGRERHDA